MTRSLILRIISDTSLSAESAAVNCAIAALAFFEAADRLDICEAALLMFGMEDGSSRLELTRKPVLSLSKDRSSWFCVSLIPRISELASVFVE